MKISFFEIIFYFCHSNFIKIVKTGTVLILFLAAFSSAFAQIGFTPSPVAEDNSVFERQLLAAWKHQEKTVAYLKGKQASEVKKSFEARYEFLSEMLTNGEFIFDSPVLTHSNEIFERIKAANPEIDPGTTMLLSRSGVANAFSTGDGFFVINLGLIARLNNSHQLAFIMGHELSHQIKNHSNEAIIHQATIVSDPERKREINRILKSGYNINSQLESLLIPGMMSRMRHSRDLEFQADSLGALLAQRAGFDVRGAVGLLHILDGVDVSIYSNPIEWDEFFNAAQCEVEPIWQKATKGSSLGDFEIKNSKYEEELKTHPDCNLRIDHIYSLHDGLDSLTFTGDETDFANIQKFAELDLIESYTREGNYSKALYYAIHAHRENPELYYPLEAAGYLLGRIAKLKKQRALGGYLELPEVYHEKDYKTFLHVIWDLNSQDCACAAYHLSRKNTETETKDLKLTALAISAEVHGEPEEAAQYAREYVTNYPKGSRKSYMDSILEIK